MLSYCLKCKRNTEIINPKVSKTINDKAIISSTCVYAVVKNQNLLNSLRTPLNKIPVLGDILF